MMTSPDFFEQAPKITVRDPLSDFLGATEGGVIEYEYMDAVKLAGHSCPTVAGTYLMILHGLKVLYGADLPERGAVKVSFHGALDEGVTGVMANVASLITGAAGDGGFKGIGPRFDRRDLLSFGQEIPGEIRLSRTDEDKAVTVSFNASIVPPHPEMRDHLQRLVQGIGDDRDAIAFRTMWQERVRAILLDHWDDFNMIVVTES